MIKKTKSSMNKDESFYYTITCPKCGHEFKFYVYKPGVFMQVPCHKCNEIIKVKL
jgi:ribosomal protein S27E